MTANQIAYAAHLENVRSNKAEEAETFRSNVAREKETAKHNRATEAETATHNRATEQETNRHNIVTEKETSRHNVVAEQQGWASISESHRHNLATEELSGSTLVESIRHNREQEYNQRTANANSYLQARASWQNALTNQSTGAAQADKLEADADYTRTQDQYAGQANARAWINTIGETIKDVSLGVKNFADLAGLGTGMKPFESALSFLN